jgi:hypothetical protein
MAEGMTSFRLRFRLPFRILCLALVAACGEVISDDGGDDGGDDVVACFDPSDCGSGEGCVQNENGDGVCLTSCTLFDDASCPSGQTCELARAFAPDDTMLTYCRPLGAGVTWENCSASDPCVVDHSCFSGTCVPHCDDAHACAESGMTCVQPSNYPFANPNNAGACQ